MDPQRWARLKELFADAAEAGDEERAGLLEGLRRDDPRLAAELSGLLAADVQQHSAADADLAAASAADAASRRPARIDRYQILGELGRGGMGRVFLAERADGAYRQRVALKVLGAGRVASEEARRRFVAERRILARLSHPSIARLIDGGTTADGEPFLVTEHVEGQHIDEFCRQRGLSAEAVVRLFLGVCDSVEAAHRSLVVHRDLKPSNVLVTAAGEPRLLDFGIAKLLDPAPGEGAADDTLAGQTPLTPRYAAPEQVRGEPITVATDVYALGVLLYELLTGISPYGEATSNPASLAVAICQRDPRPPSTASDAPAAPGTSRRGRRRIQGDLDAIVLKALRKEAAERYGSVAELAEDLRRFLEGLPVRARGGSRLYRLSKFVRRNRWRLAAAAAVAVVLAAFALERERQLRAVERERDKARAVAEFMIDVFSVADPSEERGERTTVREVLDLGAERLDSELSGQPEIRAAMLETIGRVDHRLGRVRAARPLLDRAVELRRILGGGPALARSLRLRGETAQVGGDEERAAADYREALELLGRSKGERALAAELESLLGRIELDRGHYEEARRWLERALATSRGLAAPDAEQLAATLVGLGYAEHLLGRPEQAAPRFAEAERLVRSALGHDPVQEGLLLNDLGMGHELAGRHQQALALIEEAISRLRSGLDGDHADIANALNNRGLVESELGRDEEAERSMREALAMWRRLVGDDHARTALALGNLGAVLLRRERWADAEPLLREGLRIDSRLLPPDHPNLAAGHRNLGDALRQLGRLREAEAEYRTALDLEVRILGEECEPAAKTRLALSRLRDLQGRPQEAAALSDRAITVLRRLHPRGHPRLAAALTWRAALAARTGDPAAALADLEEALAFQQAHLPADHPELLRTRRRLAEVQAAAPATIP